MPRYLVRRTFTEGLALPNTEEWATRCQEIVERNAQECVTWLSSYVTTDNKTTVCVYEGPSPEAIRMTAARNNLPVDQILRVRVLDPFSYFTGSQSFEGRGRYDLHLE